MNELNFDEIEQISGGLSKADIIALADAAIEFSKGFIDGFNANRK